jgi:hypothetical protein
MKKINSNLTAWTNKHETFTEKIKALYIAGNEPALSALAGYNDTTKGLQQILAEAIQANVPLRMLGAGWSWMKIATAENGIMVDTKQLNSTMTLSAASISPAYTGDSKKLLFAQCGTGIWELSKGLGTNGLSLKTSGASNGQTIAGAMATGAHGSSVDVGSVSDFVVGLHIILSPSKHIWLERKSSPVVTDALIQKLNTTLVQDDEMFNAAIVSFGSFGIIHGVLVEADNLFLLETNLQRMPYDAALKQLMTTLDFTNANLPNGNERPFHFAVSVNPYDLANGAYVYSFYKRPYRTDYTTAGRNAEGIGPGDDAPCFIGKLTDVVPELVPKIVNKLIGSNLTLFKKQYGTLGEIFSNTNLHGKLMSAAIGIPLSQVNKVISILIDLNQTKGPFTGIFACRFIKKSKATLGFTRFDYTCIIELDGVFSKKTNNFYQAVWKKLEAEQIPFTCHWGKMNDLNFDRIKMMYGTDVDKWIAARNKLFAGDAAAMKVFTNPILQQWGLDKVL